MARSSSISTPPATSRPPCGSLGILTSRLLCRPGGGSAIRTVMAIAERMPDVGRRYYERVLENTINRLAAYLDARVNVSARMADRRLPPRGLAIHADLVPSPRCSCPSSSRPPRLPRPSVRPGRHRQRDTDVPGRVSGEGGLTTQPVIASRREESVRVGKAKRAHHSCYHPERWWARCAFAHPHMGTCKSRLSDRQR